jgi:hypothetical protein
MYKHAEHKIKTKSLSKYYKKMLIRDHSYVELFNIIFRTFQYVVALRIKRFC